MAFRNLLVSEIFHSIQGESTLAGLPFAFVRLTGCNLRCAYCDTTYAFHGGTEMSVDQVLAAIAPFNVKHVLLTGGEPLLQRTAPALVEALAAKGYFVSIETHGEVSIEAVTNHARIIMDIKTPSSGMSRGGFRHNFRFLKPDDEVKLVIASEQDYEWAKNIVKSGEIPVNEILLSAAARHAEAPGEYPGVSARWLAEQILRDQLPVRLQVQLHKILWEPTRRGV